MTIPILVNRVRAYAVIDTGSQVTLGSQSLCEAAGIKPVEGHPITIHGVGDDMGMAASLAVDVPLAIGNAVYYWTIVIGPIREDFILGLDFLHEVGAHLDFIHGFLQISNAIIVAKFTSDIQGNRTQVAPVRANEKVVIPPLHSQTVECDLEEVFDPGTDILIEPLLMKSIHFPACVVRGGPHIYITVVNVSSAPMHIPVGRLLATARQAEVVTEFQDEDAKTQQDIVDQGAVSGATPSSDIEDPTEIPPHLVTLYHRSTANLEREECLVLQRLLSAYSDVFASHDFDLGEFSAIMHRIDTGDAPPVRHGLRRTPLGFQEEEEAHLKLMVENGIIQPSSSEWAAAPVIVKKKDGKYRYCIDYRSLNKVSRRDSYPLPLIEECLDALADNHFFSTLDMASGYWQVLIDPRDRHKTAFITKYGLYEHVRLAMGLCNSPATYQRIMTYVLQNMLWKNVLVYLDDIIILGRTFEEHRCVLESVLQRFREHNLKFKPKKCELFRTEVDFLGRRVGRNGISIPEAKIKSVLEWPVPVTKTDLESFLGFINYHRDFIEALADKAAPLYQLVKETRPNEKLIWESEHQSIFDDLIRCMVSAPVLAYPDATGLFILDVDASGVAIGAELSQIQDNSERVIAYASQALSSVQRRYCTTRKELLALVTFMNHFRFYLLGRHFIVRTDHNSLIWLMRFKNIEGQLARWLESLSQFDFKITHRPGRYHSNADGLSRMSSEECPYYEVGTSVESLPCGGCQYCNRMHAQWERFDGFVDDVLPLSVRQVVADDDIENQALQSVTVQEQEWNLRQRQDSELKIIIHWLENELEPEPGDLFLQSASVKQLWRLRAQLVLIKDILFYKWACPSGAILRHLLIVPAKHRHEIITMAHDNICSGHPGPEKTTIIIKRHFFWVGMNTDVKIYIQACDLCSRHKKGNKKPRAPMRRFHAGEPMQRVHIDILGPLTESAQHNKYILVIVDQFTKWIELKALPDQTAETVARTFIEEFVCRMGCAKEVFSDQGKNFDSKLFQQVCSLLEMAKLRTTPYRPSSNGQVERMNREILNKLRVHIDGHQSIWDRFLPFIGMAMRATVNRSTGFTPNMLMLGREVTLPMDLLADLPQHKELSDSEAEYVQILRDTLQDIHNCAREKLGSALTSRKKSYDRKSKMDNYDVGDLVYLLNSAGCIGQSRKLQPIYTGPHLIIKKISEILFATVNSRGRQQVIHHDRLRRCSDENIPLWARRERIRLQENQAEVNEEANDWSLPQLFRDSSQPSTRQDGSPTPDPDHPDNSTSLPPPTLASYDDGESESREPPPLRRSSRRPRRPGWLQDYISQRGISGAHTH